MKRPNFFIVGAPKCATTALADYLREHTQVFMSDPKEPLFFLHPESKIRKFANESHYLTLFRGADNFKAVGEASVWYLYSQHALKKIYEFNPEAKIIIMTRDPVAFVASLHAQLTFGGIEGDDLSCAWDREINRKEVDRVETIELLPEWRRMYPELIQFEKYIEKYIQTFGADNVFVTSQEQMARDVREVYLKTLSFLGVNDDGRVEFPKVNTKKEHKSEFVRKILHWTNKQEWVLKLTLKIKEKLGVRSFGLYRKIREANTRTVLRSTVQEQLAEKIQKAQNVFKNNV